MAERIEFDEKRLYELAELHAKAASAHVIGFLAEWYREVSTDVLARSLDRVPFSVGEATKDLVHEIMLHHREYLKIVHDENEPKEEG